MTMALSEKDVQYVAKLARLEVTEAETAKYTEQLGNILKYVEQLNELDTANVEPLTHPLDMKNVFRSDVNELSLTQKEVLSNGPEVQAGHFKVPKIM
jgi:aspartyl-tRNA(Asn)/glutamyl-tRNA(Gln) amidotransferase subunit C